MKATSVQKHMYYLQRLIILTCLMLPLFGMHAFADADFCYLDGWYDIPDYYWDSYSSDGYRWRFDLYDESGQSLAWLVFDAYADGFTPDTFDGQAVLDNDLQNYTDVDNIYWQDLIQVAGMTAYGVFFTKADTTPCKSLEFTAYNEATGLTCWCCVTQRTDSPYDYLQDVYDMLLNAQYDASLLADTDISEPNTQPDEVLPESALIIERPEPLETEPPALTPQEELEQQAYEEAYEAQSQTVEDDILAYLQGQTSESVGTQVAGSMMDQDIEQVYQGVKALDPGLYGAISDSAAQNWGSGPLSSHLIGQGMDTFFSDSELGRELRGFTWELGSLALGALLDWSLSEKASYTSPDALCPLSVNGSFALMRSYGSVNDILAYVEELNNYEAVNTAIEDLINNVFNNDEFSEELKFMWSDAAAEDPEKADEIHIKWNAGDGRIDALRKYQAEFELYVYRWKRNVLTGLGIRNIDSLVPFPDYNGETLLKAGYTREELEEMILSSKDGDLQKYFQQIYGEDAWNTIVMKTGHVWKALANAGYSPEELAEDLEDIDEYCLEDRAREYLGDEEYNRIDEQQYELEAADHSEEASDTLWNEYLYQIVDAQGNAYAGFLSGPDLAAALVGEDGMCSLWKSGEYFNDNVPGDIHLIIDPNGQVLCENEISVDEEGRPVDGSILYYDITPSGSVLCKTFHKDFDHGEYEALEHIDIQGNVTLLAEGYKMSASAVNMDMDQNSGGNKLTYSDIYEISWDSFGDQQHHSARIDMKTGEMVSEEEMHKAQTNDQWDFLFDQEELNGLSLIKAVNDQYALLSNHHLYDRSGKDAADLSAGQGVKSIHYANGRYWIMSNTGWYYVLDDQFERILEPVEIGNIPYRLTDYGVLVRDEETGSVNLYDETGQIRLEMPNAQIEDQKGFILGNEKAGWFNLLTGENMLIRNPAILISLEF